MPTPMEEAGRPSNYKTVMCMRWKEHGKCYQANLCNFAHGSEELRPSGKASEAVEKKKASEASDVDGESAAAGRPSNYKTVLCKSWQIQRECALGNRCNFAHGAEELRPHGAAPALAKGEKKKTAADVDRMVEQGLIDAETAGLMKSSIKRREAPAPAKGEKKTTAAASSLSGMIASFDQKIKTGKVNTGSGTKSRVFPFRLTACRGFSGEPASPMYVLVQLETIVNKHGVTCTVCKEVRPDLKKEEARRAQQLIFSASGGTVELTLEEAASIDNLESAVADVLAVRAVEDHRRKGLIAHKLRALRNASSAQVLFLLDCTGSMGSHIAAARAGIHTIQKNVLDVVPHGATLTFSFVGYRDYEDSKRFELLNFTPDTKHFSSFLESVSADGGGDQCEDVLGGLTKAAGMSWEANVGSKIMFHIADAPCHGTFFAGCQKFSDNHPQEDPTGKLTQGVLRKLCCDQGVQYIFCSINSTTANMVKKFNELLGEGGACAQQITSCGLANANDIVELASRTTTASISAATSSATATLASGDTGGSFAAKVRSSVRSHLSKGARSELDSVVEGGKEEEYSDSFSSCDPTSTSSSSTCWRIGRPRPEISPDARVVLVKSLEFPDSIAALRFPAPVDKAYSRVFEVDEKFFGKGACRKVCKAKDVTFVGGGGGGGVESSGPEEFVMKVFSSRPDSLADEAASAMQDLQTQTCAAFLAMQFSALPQISKKVGYLKAKLVCFQSQETDTGVRRWMGDECSETWDSPLRWGCVERVLEGEFSKWFSNGLYARRTDDPEYSATLEAFCHWTYQVTDGYLMVTDIQGIRVGDRFILSDPAIHCTDASRFGNTNIGEDGFSQRFSTHKCNKICKSLGLKRHPAQREVPTVTKGTDAV